MNHDTEAQLSASETRPPSDPTINNGAELERARQAFDYEAFWAAVDGPSPQTDHNADGSQD